MLVWVEHKHRLGKVILHSDDGQTMELPMVDGACPDLTPYKTGAFEEMPPIDLRTDAEKKIDDLTAQVDQLTQALKDKGALTDAEIAAAVVVDVKG